MATDGAVWALRCRAGGPNRPTLGNRRSSVPKPTLEFFDPEASPWTPEGVGGLCARESQHQGLRRVLHRRWSAGSRRSTGAARSGSSPMSRGPAPSWRPRTKAPRSRASPLAAHSSRAPFLPGLAAALPDHDRNEDDRAHDPGPAHGRAGPDPYIIGSPRARALRSRALR